MVRKIKLQRVLNEYIPKLRKHNVFNGFNLSNTSRYNYYPIISVNTDKKIVFLDRTQVDADFGGGYDDIINQLMIHFNIEKFEIEIW